MPAKRKAEEQEPAKEKKSRPTPRKNSDKVPIPKYQPTDEYQQVTKADFVERYRVPNLLYGDVHYKPDFIHPEMAETWYEELLNLDTWYQPTLKMYGRTFPQSRQIAAYSTTPNATLSYSGTTISMNYPFPEILEKMKTLLEAELGVKFNHVMLNRYDNGEVYIGKHSDNLNNLVIASVSLGVERKFILSPRLPSKTRGSVGAEVEKELSKRANVKFPLANGSLLVMQGRTQEFWKHEIPKEPSIKTGRISLTFRQLV